MKWLYGANPYLKPLGYDKLVKMAKKKYDYDMGDPEKIVMIGDELCTDIAFGNLNKMTTIFVTRWKDYYSKMKLDH